MCSLIFSTIIPDIKNIPYINEFLQKRGPDLTNHIVYKGHFYLHNLLSLTGDFTPQPLFNKEKNIVCLFNGEIYNYKEFGEYSCDSECIIPLYEKYGKTFLEMLSGEFAIIIVDYTENEVLIGVDTFGCKPLFISNFNGLGIATYKSGLDRLGFKNAEKMQANTVLIYDLKTFILKEKIQLTIFDLCQHKNTFEDYHKTFSQMITQRYKNTTKKIRSGNV